MDYAASLKSTASSYLLREMWDQANTKIEEARNVVTELSQVFATLALKFNSFDLL